MRDRETGSDFAIVRRQVLRVTFVSGAGSIEEPGTRGDLSILVFEFDQAASVFKP